jgi:hypothetical protein
MRDDADTKRRQDEAEAKRQKDLSARRKVAFEQAQLTSPLALTPEKLSVAGGLDLFNDEFVVSVAKEWGWNTEKLTLTTHRVLWSRGAVTTNQVSLYLTDIRDVYHHRSLVGFGSIALETVVGWSVQGLPAAADGDMVRDRLLAMVHWARQGGQQQARTGAAVPVPAGPPDREDQLRRLGELKAQGILSADEFQAEKTKLLTQASEPDSPRTDRLKP